MPEKIVLAYSGGLDTSIIIPWLLENYECEVIAFIADVGQGDDMREVKEKALALPIEEQAELACALAAQFRRDHPEYQQMLAQLIDDRDPNRWVKWDDLKKKLDTVQTALGTATLKGVSDKGGADKFKADFNKDLDNLTAAITKYQKHHKGKKSNAVDPLKTEVQNLRGKLPQILNSLDATSGSR